MLFCDTHLAGVERIDRERFDTIEKVENFLYVVEDESGFSLYLGEKELWMQSLSVSIKNVLSDLDKIKRRLGMISYTYPDADGDGEITAADAALILEFTGKIGNGKYSEYKTEAEKWTAFTLDKELSGSVFPDIYGDGRIGADDSSEILAFIAAVGSDKYQNSADGFRAFMLDQDGAILGAGISGFRVMTKAQYDAAEHDPEIVYIVDGGGNLTLYYDEQSAYSPPITPTAIVTGGIPQSALVIGAMTYPEEGE